MEGLHLCEEALNSDYEIELFLYCPQKITSKREQELLKKVQSRGIPTDTVSLVDLSKLTDTENPQGLIAIVEFKDFSFQKFIEKPPKQILVLDRINDPGNMGTIFRTAAWFGIQGVLISRYSVEWSNPKVIRASMGAIFYLPILAELDLIPALRNLKKLDYKLLVADLQGTTVYDKMGQLDKFVLIVGNEISGVQEEIKALAHHLVRIPKRGQGESLNVAIVTAILLAQLTRN